jgi:hypothetical protein
MEGELGAYREAMVSLAMSRGVEVPDFVTDESGHGLGEAGSGEKLRVWLAGVLYGQQAAAVQAEGSGSRGPSTRGRRKKDSTSRSKTTRGKSSRTDRMDEGD